MQLRTLIRLASDSIAYYWPMRTFVHHNPLHGLEHLPFEVAAEQAQQSIGGNGFLSNQTFRDYFLSGRILPRHLDVVLKPLTLPEQVKLGVREISHMDVLRACMLGDLAVPSENRLKPQLARHPDRHMIAGLANYLASAVNPPAAEKASKQLSLGTTQRLASWCDHALGTQIDEQINREMVKWC